MSNQDHLTDELGRELHRRVDALYDAPLTLDDVRGRARGIRRRRRVAAVAGTAAAVALVAALSSTLTGGLNRADEPQPAPSPSTGTGASVLHDREVTLPGGDTVAVDVDNADVSQLGVLTDGRILVANQKLSQIEVYDADGAPVTTYAGRLPHLHHELEQPARRLDRPAVARAGARERQPRACRHAQDAGHQRHDAVHRRGDRRPLCRRRL